MGHIWFLSQINAELMGNVPTCPAVNLFMGPTISVNKLGGLLQSGKQYNKPVKDDVMAEL